ncbi:MAG: hypothetical protein Aureis2KO_02000 [Aureisphaera sp.]
MKKNLYLALIAVLLISCSSDDTGTSSANDGSGNNDEDPIAYDPSAMLSFTPCMNGKAGHFDCFGYDLVSHIPISFFDAQNANDSWGWTDPMTSKEYVILGLTNGTAFIDISNPENPLYLGKLPSSSFNNPWRDIKVYNDHAFIVSQGTDHGMQVFNLARLRDVENPPVTFDTDAHFTNFGGMHNIIINEDTGYAYAVGGNTFDGGPHFVNIQNPLNPVDEGGFSFEGYCHDAQVITYNGPDTDHIGKEILFGSNENKFVIVDVSDKSNPQTIATQTYLQTGFTHQGWFTEDQRYFLLGDEFDEIDFGFNTRTVVLDLLDLDNPQLHFNYFGVTSSIDHNGYTKGNLFYQANYTGGMRVMDISNIANQEMIETGHFDTFPINNGASFDGVWNVYPFFDSGNIALSDLDKGLFIVRKN